MQTVLPVVTAGGMSQGAAVVPDEGAQSAVPNTDDCTEARQTGGKTSFISIFIQGKSQVGKTVAEQEKEKTLPEPAVDSEAKTAADADSVVFDQLVRLFATATVTGDGARTGSGPAAVSVSGPPASEAAAVLNARQAVAGTPENGGEQAAAADFKTGMVEKITDAMKAVSGGTRESRSDEAALKEKESPTGEITEGFAPASGTAFAGTTEPADDGELLSSAVERALDRFADDLSSVEAGSSEIRLVLEPKSLGELTISVSRGDNGISAKIRSDNRETCAVISDQIQHLIRSMEDKGIKVRDVDVAFGPMEQDPGFTQNGRGSGREYTSQYDSPQTHEKPEMSDRAGFFDTWNDYGTKDGAVEYRI